MLNDRTFSFIITYHESTDIWRKNDHSFLLAFDTCSLCSTATAKDDYMHKIQ